MRAYALHARALDAIGRADFENAYRDACAISPPGPSRRTFRMRCGSCWTWSRQRCDRPQGRGHRPCRSSTGNRSPRDLVTAGLITSGAAAMAATDDDDAITLFEQALAEPGADQWPFDWLEVQLLFGERLRRRGQQLAPVSCSPPHAMPSSASTLNHGRDELATSCRLPVSRPAGWTSSGQRH